MKSSITHMVVTIVFCIVAIIGYGIWYAALYTKSTEVATLESDIRTKTAAVARIAATRAALEGVANDEEVVHGYFVPADGVVTFINSLETQSKTLGASLSVLSVATGGTTLQPTLELALTVKGKFEAVMQTVGAIEYLPYGISVSSLSIVHDAKNSWHADLKLLVGSLPAMHAPLTYAFF